MRVISGIYKARRILPPVNDNVRPTTDKVKEAIFDIVQFDVKNAVVIDLFAGSGALGIEALSRGAAKTYFCDASGQSIDLLKKNVSFLQPGTFEILKGDYADCLRRLETRGVKANVVLLDPPYGKGLPQKAIEEIQKREILSENGVIIVERECFDEPQRKYYAYTDVKTFGKTCLDVYRNATKCAVTGTFDPFTLGHKFVVEKALENFDFVHVVILVNEEKKARYSVETRKRMIELSLKEYKRRIRIDYFSGLTVDYCAENGIQCIYRGVRNERDEEYEREMAAYNREHGNVETVMVRAENEISSTCVKEAFDAGQNVGEYVAEGVIGLMKKR